MIKEFTDKKLNKQNMPYFSNDSTQTSDSFKSRLLRKLQSFTCVNLTLCILQIIDWVVTKPAVNYEK